MKNWINLTEEQLQKELELAQKAYRVDSDSFLTNEVMGRVFYWMKDPVASDYFRKAIEQFLTYEPLPGIRYLTIGNYCRLANDLESGHQYLVQAYEILKREMISVIDPALVVVSAVGDLIKVCFLLKRYEEAVEYGIMLRKDDPNFDPELLNEQFTLLAEAKLNNNLTKAEKAVEQIGWLIYSERARISDDGPITLWDAYDIALQTVAELKESTEEDVTDE